MVNRPAQFVIAFQCQCSSVVEQRFRKPSVRSSNLLIGSISVFDRNPYSRAMNLRTGILVALFILLVPGGA